MKQQRILLIIGGGIAAYKCLDLIRRLREAGASVRAVMTRAAGEFVTPLSVGALTSERVFTDLFDLNDEQEIGHIRLSREADLLIVAPATADLIAKMAGGHADDLASTVLLATDKPVLVAPAMNPRMWLNPATQRNVAQLRADCVHFVGPNTGEMAERDEAGPGRLAEVPEIIEAASKILAERRDRPVARLAGRPLAGRHVLVTSGPTHEPIDPVRYIANRSSGRQGHAIARAAAEAGATVTLVSGPVDIPHPPGVTMVEVETAYDMLDAVEAALPADIAIFAAAVSDWRVAAPAHHKIKKSGDGVPSLALTENPDILATVAHRAAGRPGLVVGFAAETENVIENARAKLTRKGCDLMVANDVTPDLGVMGGDDNTVHLVSRDKVETWPTLDKDEVARRLIVRLTEMAGAARP